MITQDQFNMLMQNPNTIQQQVEMFKQQLLPQFQNQNPMAIVQQKMASGEMNQDDFQRCRMMANAMLGVNY